MPSFGFSLMEVLIVLLIFCSASLALLECQVEISHRFNEVFHQARLAREAINQHERSA
jgi:prepilin-type N-terminal cleavage/methylation domain-containing protein